MSLVRIRTPQGSMTLKRGGALRVGRNSANDVVLKDSAVSRYHAEIRWDAHSDVPEVRDRGSQNGLWVDGRRTKQALLYDGSRVEVGPFELIVSLQGERAKRGERVAMPQDECAGMMGFVRAEGGGAQILQQLEADRRSGALFLSDDERIIFCAGRVLINSSRARRNFKGFASAPAGTFYRFDGRVDVDDCLTRQLLSPSDLLRHPA